MKKTLLFLILFISFVFIFVSLKNQKNEKQENVSPDSIKNSSSVSPKYDSSKNLKIRKFIFVPYWTIEDGSDIGNDGFNDFVYFGITADKNGINKEGLGYKRLNIFSAFRTNKDNNFLSVVMTDSGINSLILEDKKTQENLINESIDIAKQYSFKGVVLDFEISALSFEKVIKDINSFYGLFYEKSKKKNLDFKITIYGDVFYRIRPYDLTYLSKNSDGVMIMAYDFHKSKGNPGPNFPLKGREKYGYDFENMINDFLKKVPKEKIEVVFGLFGYDWTVNEKNESIKNAKALSFNEIKNKFLGKCYERDCIIKRDDKSSETKITYKDENLENHIVWFEDMESVGAKIEYLKTKGINSVGYWAYSYF
ncbi:MAG: glycosyl hydrolase family 18 protein [Candidatus Levybacteria bacterium]|nr:glycosyl hydrolase family 18 protein [Candidatus Levybacteria bacterium]